jgi:tRNA(Ile)-lysidine synthase
MTALEAHAATLVSAPRILVAYSGGLDSTVLLHATHLRFPGAVAALHANHGLHGDAQSWERHCRAFCNDRRIPLCSTRLRLARDGSGPEAAARAARMAWFAEQLGPGEPLLLAQHRDDQAETLLLRLLRGAGPDGLAAMAPERPLGAGRLLRPLLALSRSTLAAFAQRHGLRWIEDPSNSDDRYDRNYLRHRIMPLLRGRWAGCDATLARAAELLRESAGARSPAPARCFSVIGDPGFSLEAVRCDAATAAERVRAWLRDAGLTMPGRAHLDEFLRQSREGQGASLATRDWTLTRFRDAVFAHPGFADTPAFERGVAVGERLVLPGIGTIEVRGDDPAAPGEDGGTLVLALRAGGERLAASRGIHRPLKTVLQEKAVPPWWRGRMPLLFEEVRGRRELLAAGSLIRTPRCRELGLHLLWRPALLDVAGARKDGNRASDD